jgi:hypothetical protein
LRAGLSLDWLLEDCFHVWKQAIHTNGSRRRQDSFSFLVERHEQINCTDQPRAAA